MLINMCMCSFTYAKISMHQSKSRMQWDLMYILLITMYFKCKFIKRQVKRNQKNCAKKQLALALNELQLYQALESMFHIIHSHILL